jgi:DNA-binding transcriptional MerR regulator
MASHTTYTISDLAREFDLTTRAIRFYEDMGLLQPKRTGPGGRSRCTRRVTARGSSSCCAPNAWG